MKRLATICARGGSKGVPGKNIRPLLGKPLLAHTVEHAMQSALFAHIAISSDDAAIRDAAITAGADIDVARPAELATDVSGKLAAIRHCVLAAEEAKGCRFDTIVDLDATSPLRIPGDIVDAVSLLEQNGLGNVITGAPARRSPYFNLVEVSDDGAVSLSKPLDDRILRRQDAPNCYDMNASIYVWRRDHLLQNDSLFTPETRLYEMPEERSWDIDSELDFEIVRMIMERRLENE